jgi:hypothetical protein
LLRENPYLSGVTVIKDSQILLIPLLAAALEAAPAAKPAKGEKGEKEDK